MKTTNNHGFTLIEVILYALLIGLIFSGLVVFSLSIFGLYAKSKSMEEVLAAVRQVNNAVGYYMENEAIAISVPSSSTSSTSVTMQLSDKRQVHIFVEDAILKMQFDDSQPMALTGNEIKIENFKAENYGDDRGPSLVRIICKISFAQSDSQEQAYAFDYANMFVVKNSL